MYRDLWWKALVIAFLILISAIYVYPPSEKLKLGLDLAGGTSLIYEIDSSDLEPAERRGLAERMIPILLKRIDPTHVANIVMRPQGDTRIEIQLPVASLDTRNKRDAYDVAIKKLESENINLLQVKRALSLDVAQRQTILSDFCKDSTERKAIIDQLAEVYDLRSTKQKMRDELITTIDKLKEQLSTLGLKTESLTTTVASWNKLPKDQQKKQIEDFVKAHLANDQAKSEMIVPVAQEYLLAYGQWVAVMNEITDPQNGLNARWNKAVGELANVNLNTDTLRQVLEMSVKSTKRADMLKETEDKFPSRKEQIAAVISAYDDYVRVGGKLDDPEDLKRMLKGSGVLEFRILPGFDLANAAAYKEALATKGPKGASDSQYIWCEVEDPATWQGGITGQFGDKLYVLASNQDGEKMTRSAKEWKLKKAYPTADQEGRRAIGFTFDDVAANLFFSLTGANIEKPLCILLDNIAISAPNINSAISSSGIITGGRGGFTPTQVDDMVNKLNAGSFPARLSEVPISEKTIGPAVGADNKDRGLRSGKIALAAVAVFMIMYYLFGGCIADIALLLNVLFLLAIMSILRGTFTMGGIAGMVLTIGMSVDANVLIFERLREEQKRGSSLRAAIANGYSRAFRTILDSNVTTFFTAMILYLVASEEIKGFALVLMIGIACSMFTALFVTRLIFDFLTRRNLISGHLKMMGLFGNINVNWMKLRPVFMVFSGILIIGGITVFFTRDEKTNSKYDIEFTGGTSAQIDLKAATGFDRGAVEKKFQDYANNTIHNSALAAAKIYSVGQTGLQYEITTTETNSTTVTVQLNQPGMTVQELTGKIHEAEDDNNFILSRLSVTSKDAKTFEITTSRVSATMVEQVVSQAVGQDGTVSKPQVNEIVADAIRNAFGDYLAVQKNLGPVIVSADKINDVTGELAEFLGGVKITCKLSQETTAKELRERIQGLRAKPDFQNLKWYRDKLFSNDLAAMNDNDIVRQFIYVSLHPEAGSRELSETEWNSFVENEKTKLVAACSMESTLSRMTQIDPSIGSEAKTRAILAVVLSLLGIVGYIWFRFGTARYGFAAIASLVHDVLITLGVIAGCTYIANTVFGKAILIEDFKINLDMIAAILTLIGYSLNDTIVVFDRIRENRGKDATPTAKVINDSINQTLSRTFLTSFTTFLAIFIMYVWGGSGFRGFNFAMMFGIFIGTYSSIAIAAPILLLGGPKKKETA